jgi:hypothetical protein
LLEANAGAGVGFKGNAGVQLSSFLLAGVLLKLLLQPFQLFLTTFYRQLSFPGLAVYLATYYVYLVATVLLVFFNVATLVSTGWVVGLFGVCCVGVLFFIGGLSTVVDFRLLLAFSTLVNVNLLLVAACGS